MARVYNTYTPATYAEQIWNAIQGMVSAGATIVGSGDGLSATSTTTSILSGGAATGANGFDNTGAWVQLQMPARSGVTYYLVIQHDTIGGGRAKLHTAKMSGSSTATRVPTGGTVVLGSGTDASPTYAGLCSSISVKQHVIYDAAAPFDFFSVAYPSGGGDQTHLLCWDPIVPHESGATDVVLGICAGWAAMPVDQSSSGLWARVRQGLSGAAIAQIKMAASVSADGVISGRTGTKRMTTTILYRRQGSGAPEEEIGKSVLWRASASNIGCPHNGTVTTTRDRAIFGPVVTLWDGTTL